MELLQSYWSPAELATNGLILLHLLGALAVGLLLGYERSYHGRAAGMRTYGLVCLASAALTVVNAYPGMWYGGIGPQGAAGAGDPTRVIQGIVTGIGFLGAGVIMREGLSIRGLSTAASIWATSAIGITIGLGFYAVAIAAALLTILVMSLLRPLERLLPHRSVIHLTLVFSRDKAPPPESLRAAAKQHGFDVVDWAFHLTGGSGHFECQLVLQAKGDPDPMSLVAALASTDSVVEFKLSPSRI
ncbi:MgtC/SapB family protein [Azospirillum picis]|uniref:Protein MgtC n=1 Tax=Azospirillum picis TaxID=488438 RepID=A0ABU0MKG4_9PROT|nr:MgtC/SapB family protein [Azospirillum picis]MBP2300033.1 putative Mg2+ transporter-C (MgtC) family protein [Azospirillum picis]MDQ0533729.1 putative Mg2+ transporter-C (MgtC) family protein [Azospirillum picis]